MRKCTLGHVHSIKTQISLHCSHEDILHTQLSKMSLPPQHWFWSDCVSLQADLNLPWVNIWRHIFWHWSSFHFSFTINTSHDSTIFTRSIRQTPQLLTILVLKFEQVHLLTDVSKNCWMSRRPDEMLHSATSHLVLHCLLRPVCLNIYGKYGI